MKTLQSAMMMCLFASALLSACIARIPPDASAGLRMIAEQSCERDEANRKAILSVPVAQ